MGETENKAPKESFFTGLSAEFKKIIWPDKKSLASNIFPLLSSYVLFPTANYYSLLASFSL